jgi:hypothetical protein
MSVLRRIGFSLALWAMLPVALSGQIEGVVTDMSGMPLDNVIVEAWSPSGRLAVTVTGEDGRFAFVRPIAERATGLYAHRLGYQAVRPEVLPGVREYLLRMVEDPLPIEGIVVDAERAVCTTQEDEEARHLWAAAARRYSSEIDHLGMATYLASSIQAVPVSSLGPVPLSGGGVAQRGSAPLFRASWRRRVQRQGYARPLSAPSPDGMYEAWGYPPLEADFATHFVDPVFGELHRFTLEEKTGSGTTLRFCPAEDDKPTIRGVLRLGPDTSLVLAEWSFETPEPAEGAGGRAVFTTGALNGQERYLLPSEGLFWRRIGVGRYLQRYEKFEGWIIAPGDSVPFLPVRTRADEEAERGRASHEALAHPPPGT